MPLANITRRPDLCAFKLAGGRCSRSAACKRIWAACKPFMAQLKGQEKGCNTMRGKELCLVTTAAAAEHPGACTMLRALGKQCCGSAAEHT